MNFVSESSKVTSYFPLFLTMPPPLYHTAFHLCPHMYVHAHMHTIIIITRISCPRVKNAEKENGFVPCHLLVQKDQDLVSNESRWGNNIQTSTKEDPFLGCNKGSILCTRYACLEELKLSNMLQVVLISLNGKESQRMNGRRSGDIVTETIIRKTFPSDYPASSSNSAVPRPPVIDSHHLSGLA